MPATGGWTRRPHNNRVSTSGALKTSDIWSKTIGHDPYAAEHETESNSIQEGNSSLEKEKARGIMELARHQNIANRGTGGVNGNEGQDDFARKMFFGLKTGKLRAADKIKNEHNQNNLNTLVDLEGNFELSSSEDEFIEVSEHEDTNKEGKNLKGKESKSKKKKRKKDHSKRDRKSSKRRKRSDSTSSSGSDSEDSRRRKRKRSKSKKRKKEKTGSKRDK